MENQSLPALCKGQIKLARDSACWKILQHMRLGNIDYLEKGHQSFVTKTRLFFDMYLR